MKRGERRRGRGERTEQTLFGVRWGEKYVKMEWRCPHCSGDNRLHLPVENVVMVKCGHRWCRKWSALSELRRLWTDFFAPPLNAGYEGAVRITEIDRHDWSPDYGLFVTHDREDRRGAIHGGSG